MGFGSGLNSSGSESTFSYPWFDETEMARSHLGAVTTLSTR